MAIAADQCVINLLAFSDVNAPRSLLIIFTLIYAGTNHNTTAKSLNRLTKRMLMRFDVVVSCPAAVTLVNHGQITNQPLQLQY